VRLASRCKRPEWARCIHYKETVKTLFGASPSILLKSGVVSQVTVLSVLPVRGLLTCLRRLLVAALRTFIDSIQGLQNLLNITLFAYS